MKAFFAFALRVSPLLRLFRHSKVCLLTYYVTDTIVITIMMALAIRSPREASDTPTYCFRQYY